MKNSKLQSAQTEIKRITYYGMAVNIALSIIKIFFGIIVSSLSLVSDGIHSFSDLLTDFAVIVGVKISSKKPDDKHPYGHGRSETFAAFFIAAVLILVGCFMIYYAAMNIARQVDKAPSVAVALVALISVVSKEVLYRLTKKKALKLDSSMLYANAWHHRSDAFSSIAVIIGYIIYFFDFANGDQLAAIVVAVMIIFTAAKILNQCIGELSESRADSGTIEQINKILSDSSNIAHWHNLRTRVVGREVFMDLHILVSPELNIKQAHQISEDLESTLHREIKKPVNITVHIEPDIEEFRK